MPKSHTYFQVVGLLAGLLIATFASNAAAQPVIDWVTPPVWMQTQTDNTSALPGTRLIRQTWISTGRGGKAMIRLGLEQVEINENSLWEWAGQNDDSSGNAVQGGMRVSSASAAVPLATEVPAADQPVRLHRNAPWMLALDAGKDQSGAEGISNFLRNSGYPVSEPQKIKRFFGDRWQIGVNGFMSSEAATAMGKSLLALAPGILGATAQRLAIQEAAPVASGDAAAPTDAAVPGKTPEELPEVVATPLRNLMTKALSGWRQEAGWRGTVPSTVPM